MFANCISPTIKLSEHIKDLEALNLWLNRGRLKRWAVVVQTKNSERVWFFWSPEDAINSGRIVPSFTKIVEVETLTEDEVVALAEVHHQIGLGNFVEV